MRYAILGLSLATMPLVVAASLTAAAQPALPVAAEAGPDVGLPHPPSVQCRPVYAPVAVTLGPARADAERRTEGLLLIGMVCTSGG